MLFGMVPAVSTWPMMTSDTMSGDTPTLLRASLIHREPRSCAGILDSAPFRLPETILKYVMYTIFILIIYLTSICWGQPDLSGRLPPGQLEILQHVFYLKILSVAKVQIHINEN